MADKMMHLGWFCNFMPGEWNTPFAAGWPPWDGKFHVEIAQAMERACFDYIMLEDTLMVSEAYGGSAEVTLKHALLAPKHDPGAAGDTDRRPHVEAGRGRDAVHDGLSAVHAGAALFDA
jgi:hypothetical protein